MRLGMIADDVTGACDAGVQFAARGFSACVWFDGAAIEPAEMTVLSTDSRGLAPECAALRVRDACAALARHGVRVVYKKIDSTLHGNISAELAAVLDACGYEEAWVAPAFPAQGRTVADGWLSARKVHLPSLLLDPRLRAFDAASQEDLAAIARRAFTSGRRVLLAGSAGLAMEMAALLAARQDRHPRPSLPPAGARGPVLFVIGSLNPATAAQVQYLLRERRGHRVVRAEWRPGELDGLPDLIRSYRAVVFSGGDTARLACWVLKANGIRLDREILAGIPCGTLAGGPLDGFPVATKAGGFGKENALAVIADSLS